MIVTDLIGMPYTKDHDCNWLAAECAKRSHRGYPTGLETPENEDDWPEMFRKVLLEHYRQVDIPKEGDIAIFAIPVKEKTSCHCGTITAPGWMITTRQTVGVHMARLNHPLWKTMLKGFYEFVA